MNSKETHWVLLFIDGNTVIYFGLSISLKKYYKKIRDKSITHNTLRIQDNESIMCIFYCITFIEYMLAGKTLLDYINFFSLNDYKKNGKIIHKCYKDKYDRRSKS